METDRKGETDHFDIVEHTLENYTKELVARTLDGWVVSPTNTGEVVGLYGGTYTVSMYRNANTVDRMKDKSDKVRELPKPTRAEILQRARDAKHAKKMAGSSTK